MDRDRQYSSNESDPLAELARLIGQTDPRAEFGREGSYGSIHDRGRPSVQAPELQPGVEGDGMDGPPPWATGRANAQAAPEQGQPSGLHPLRRYAAAHHLPDPTYHTSPRVAHDPDPNGQYDDALYGPAESGMQAAPGYDEAYQDQAYYEDYADEDDYDDGADDRKRRRGGLTTVVAVLALAVVGTGAAFAYRTFVGSPRSGEPPIIKADAGPNKVVPPSASADNSKQIQDRLATGNGAEQLVSREEQPVDVNSVAQSGPRVVFPPLNQNTNPPSTASVAPGDRFAPNAGSAAVAGTEPRKIRTLAVRSDEGGPGAAEAAPTPAPPPTTRAAAPAAPAPSAPAPQPRVASNNPTQTPPEATAGGYLVQVSSQRSEADARASFRVLQQKFPSAIGSRAPVIKRADLGSKGVYYRAMIGPFAAADQAVQFCTNLKAAGGQCVVQRN